MKNIKYSIYFIIATLFAEIALIFFKKNIIETAGFLAYVLPIFSVIIAGAIYYEEPEQSTSKQKPQNTLESNSQIDSLPLENDPTSKSEKSQKHSYFLSIIPLLFGSIFQFLYIFKELGKIEIYTLIVIGLMIIMLSLALIKISWDRFKIDKQNPMSRIIFIWGLAPYSIIATLILLFQLIKVSINQ